MKIEFAEQDLIDDIVTTPACTELFEKVLMIDLSKCWLSDQSSLADFAGSGMTNKAAEKYDYDWDAWVLDRIHEEFQVVLASTRLSIIEVVGLIQQAQKPPLLN